MRKDGVCLCCGGEVEFVSHALWSVNSFCDLMQLFRLRLTNEEMELGGCIVYFIWAQRNEAIYEGAEKWFFREQ